MYIYFDMRPFYQNYDSCMTVHIFSRISKNHIMNFIVFTWRVSCLEKSVVILNLLDSYHVTCRTSISAC